MLKMRDCSVWEGSEQGWENHMHIRTYNAWHSAWVRWVTCRRGHRSLGWGAGLDPGLLFQHPGSSSASRVHNKDGAVTMPPPSLRAPQPVPISLDHKDQADLQGFRRVTPGADWASESNYSLTVQQALHGSAAPPPSPARRPLVPPSSALCFADPLGEDQADLG